MVSDRRSAARSLLFILALATATLTQAAPSLGSEPTAADKETARSLMQEGDRRFEAQDYGAALKAYAAAHEIMGVPTTGLSLAQAQQKLGLLVEARDTALSITRYPRTPNEPSAFTEAREGASQLADRLATLIPSIELDVSGPAPSAAVKIEVDGVESSGAAIDAPQKLNPGRHSVRVVSHGFREATVEVTLQQAETKVVHVALEPLRLETAATTVVQPPVGSNAPHPKAFPWLAVTGFGVGAAGIVVGAVTGGLSLAKAGDVEEQCDGTRCPATTESDIHASKVLARVADVAFAVGVVGLAVGTVGVLTFERSPAAKAAARPKMAPFVGVTRAGLVGRF